MVKKLLIGILMVMVMSGTAMTTDMHLGQDTWGLDTWYDYRTYHESHPGSQIAKAPGGWFSGITAFGDNASLINRVEQSFGLSWDGAIVKVVHEKPASYWWIDRQNYDWGFFSGHNAFIGQDVTLTAYDSDGNPINFIDGEVDLGTSLSATFPLETPTPTICKIKRMAIKKDGSLMVKFTAPYTDMNTQIRIRIFSADGLAGLAQLKFDPPYQFTKKDGTVVPDVIKTFIDGQYAGNQARIEYRKFHENGFMTRGITYFVLPSVEE